jgi:hypothetical protein
MNPRIKNFKERRSMTTKDTHQVHFARLRQNQPCFLHFSMTSACSFLRRPNRCALFKFPPQTLNMLNSRRVRFQVVTPGVQKQWMYIPFLKFLGIMQIRNNYRADIDTSITAGVEKKFRVFKYRSA